MVLRVTEIPYLGYGLIDVYDDKLAAHPDQFEGMGYF